MALISYANAWLNLAKDKELIFQQKKLAKDKNKIEIEKAKQLQIYLWVIIALLSIVVVVVVLYQRRLLQRAVDTKSKREFAAV